MKSTNQETAAAWQAYIPRPFLRAWQQVTNLGINQSINKSPEHNRTRLTNQVSALVVAEAFLFFWVFRHPEYRILMLLNIWNILAFSGCLWLNYTRQYLKASMLMLTALNITVFIIDSYLGPGSGVYLLFFPLMVLSLLLLENRPLLVSFEILLSLLCLLFLHLTGHALFIGVQENDFLAEIFFYASVCSAVPAVSVSIYSIISHGRRQAARLRTEKQNLRIVLDNTAQAIMLVNNEGICELLNNRAAEYGQSLTGRFLKTGEPAELIIKPDDKATYRKNLEKAINGELVSFILEEHGHKRELSHEITMKPISDTETGSRKVLLIITDISLRREADLQIQYNQARMSLLHSLSVGSMGFSEDIILQTALEGLNSWFADCRATYGIINEQTGTWTNMLSAGPVTNQGAGTESSFSLQGLPEAYSNLTGTDPIIVPDVQKTSWLHTLQGKLIPYGSASVMFMPCHSVGKTIGLLMLSTPDKRRWTDGDIGILTGVGEYLALVLREASGKREKMEVAERLQQSVKEKEILLGEIHHRVKNNMAVISGLLNMQSHFIEEPVARHALQESQNRIRSMALIHDKLYQNDSFSELEFNSYLRDLIANIQNSQTDLHRPIRIRFASESEKYLSMMSAVPCGLIMNELISNAYKHAFTDRESGNIFVSFTQEESRYTLSVEDDGVGYRQPEGKKRASLGLTLVEALSGQLKSKLKIETIPGNGTRFSLTFEDLGAKPKA
ncbi:MAG: histidine kinase dimerization/phosphoacceptor domain -containing protein [Bacteroidota bacterium]